MHPGPHQRSRLAGLLRPDVPDESARKTLRDAVYELRRAFAPAEPVVATRATVELRAEVDLAAFRDARAAGAMEAAAAAAGTPPRELLAGLDCDWALRARDEHAAEVAGVLAALARDAEEAGDLARAIAWTRARIEHEPLAEAAHRDLIRLLARAGDRPAALAAADALAERLRRELRVPPSAQTRALVDELRRARQAPPPLPAPLARTAPPAGRERQLERLRSAWADVQAGTLRIALVTGEPGIGKTTLIGAFAREVHAAGATVLFGRSDDQGLLPYQPWVEALERQLDGELPDPALARLLPSLGGGEPVGVHDRYRAFEAVRRLLEDAAPVLLVLDDLQWADPDSLQLLRHIVRMAQAPLLIAITARETELDAASRPALADLRREVPLLQLELTGLDTEAVAAILARRRAHGDPAAYRARTGGNPFFLDELLREEVEGDGPPPPGVREVIGRRIARLPASARDVLQAGAAQGREFEPLLLTAPALVMAGLAAATEAGLLTQVGPSRYAFAHALVRETVLAGMDLARRAALHHQIAGVLATSGGPKGEIAKHLRHAGPLVPAERRIAAELDAAREAEAMLAFEDAAAHYEAALAAGAPDRGAILLALGAAHDRAGRQGPARAAFGEALALARRAGDPVLLARAALGRGGLGVLIAAPDPTITRDLEEALAHLPGHERALAAWLRARLAIELYYPDRGRAEALSAQAVEAARASGDPAALAMAHNARRVALWTPERIGERLQAASAMVAAAEAAGSRECALQGRNWRIVDLLELGRRRELEAELDAYERLADALGLAHYRWYVPLWRGALALLEGRWAQLTGAGDEALALAHRAGDPMAAWLVRGQRESALEVRGRFEAIDRGWLLQQAATSAEPWAWKTCIAFHDAALGDTAAARRTFAALMDALGPDRPAGVNWHALGNLADTAALLDDRDAAARLYPRLAPHAALFPVVARGGLCLGSAEYFVGRLAATLGRRDEAERRYRRAIEANLRIGARPRATIARWRLGELLGSRATLLQAAADAQALGMSGVAERARAAADSPLALAA